MSTLSVRIQDNAASSNFTTFVNQELIINLDEESKVYFVKEIEGQFNELEFGNGVIGKALANGNLVNLAYLVTNEDAGNGARVFSYTGSTLLGGSVAVTTVTPAVGGAVAETIESIRYNAPRAYSAQNRAVTVEDYRTMIFRLYPEAQTINVWGGEDNDPPIYGKVFLSIKPTTTDVLTQNQKDYIKDSILKEKNVVSITPEIVDPEFINIKIESSIYYNPRLTAKSENTLKSLVVQTIKDYNTDNLNSFTGVFRHSNLSALIDNTEDSIVSNITTIKLHREVDVQYNTNANYTINLGNPIYGSGVAAQSILSTGFYIAGNDNIVYIEDLPTDENTGQLRLWYYSSDIKTYLRTFGSVDYPNGIIRLTELEITGIDLTDSPVLELMIKPQSNDVVSIRNQLVTIPDNNITVNVVLDKVSVGDPGGGTNYIFTSSRN
jgi:hypothetical protein